jgi:DeoR/GlpR family transcriptional regulator of sugar metabolism
MNAGEDVDLEMLAVSRRKEMVDLLDEQQSMSVSELSKRFQVTEETIRKDLEKLEAEGCLKRTHGGAVRIPDVGQELPFSLRNQTHKHEKRMIAMEAAKLVSDYDIVVLDASSTSLQLAYQLNNKKEITVITNSLNVLNVLKDCPWIHVFCTGGILRTQSLCFVGESAEEMLKKFVINKAFISTRGITLNDGLLEPNEQEARMKKTMIQLAKEVILLQDHSKFGKSAFYPITPIDQIDYLITDEGTGEEYVNSIKQLGKTVIIAREE